MEEAGAGERKEGGIGVLEPTINTIWRQRVGKPNVGSPAPKAGYS